MIEYGLTLNEGVITNSLKDILHKTELTILEKFIAVGTFGSLITLFLPVTNELIKNSRFSIELSLTNIVLATIGAFTVLIDKDRHELSIIWKKLKEESWKQIVNELVSVFKNIGLLFKNILNEFGKVISSFTDMASYLFLTTPFLNILLEFIKTNKVSFSDITGMSMSIGAGVILIAGKNVVEYIMKKLEEQNIKESFSGDLNEKFNWFGLGVWTTFVSMIILSGIFHEVKDFFTTHGGIQTNLEMFIVLLCIAYRNEIKNFLLSNKGNIQKELGERIDENETFPVNEGLFSYISSVWNKLKRMNVMLNSSTFGIFKKLESNNNLKTYVSQIISSNSSSQRMGYYNMISNEIDRVLTPDEKIELDR